MQKLDITTRKRFVVSIQYIMLGGLLSLVCIFSKAADTIPPPPAIPSDDADSENIDQPKVTIIREEDKVIEEYRVRGQLRYVKIIPNKGPAYYMIDTDGDGELDTQHDDLVNPPINQWILWRW